MTTVKLADVGRKLLILVLIQLSKCHTHHSACLDLMSDESYIP